MRSELIVSYIRKKVSKFLDKFDMEILDKFDPEISSISVNLYILRQANEDGKVFIPLGTPERPKGLRLTIDGQLIVVLDEDNTNPSFIFKEDLQRFVKENRDNRSICEPSIDQEFETSGFDVSYTELLSFIKKIESDKSTAPF